LINTSNTTINNEIDTIKQNIDSKLKTYMNTTTYTNTTTNMLNEVNDTFDDLKLNIVTNTNINEDFILD